jgi:uncharacterized Zn finger protein
VFIEAGVALFPRTWGDVRANCNCPDWENPCKHIAAVLYVYADQLDTDPWLLLLWRGRTRDKVLGRIRAGSSSSEARGSVAPWWPLVAGRTRHESRPADAPFAGGAIPVADRPNPATRVLQRMEPLEAEVGGTTITELLAVTYEVLRDPPIR